MGRVPARLVIVDEMFGDYCIVYDGQSYTARKKGIRKKVDGSTEVKENIIGGYCSDIYGALDEIIKDKNLDKAKKSLNKIEVITLRAYLKHYVEIKNQIQKMLDLNNLDFKNKE